MTLGLNSGGVKLAEDHTAWAEEFARERERIVAALAGHIVRVEHVGSTALVGVPAKPILDILIGVSNFEEASVCVGPMESLGYEYRGEYGIARRHYFVKGSPRTHHVHMVETTSDGWRDTLGFRDVLRARPELAREYAKAKMRLAGAHGDNRTAYQEVKDRVIERMLRRI